MLQCSGKPSFIGLRLFLYDEVPPEKRYGLEYGLFLFNIQCYQRNNTLNPNIHFIQRFKLSALLNRDFYTLAKEAINSLGHPIFDTPKTREKLAQQIYDQFLIYGINFVRMPCVKVSHLPLVIFVLDFLILDNDDKDVQIHSDDDGGGDAIEKTLGRKYIRDHTLEEKLSIASVDDLVNLLISKSYIHMYLKNLEFQDVEDTNFDDFLDTLRSMYAFKDEKESVARKTFFQIKLRPLLESIQKKHYLGDSNDICCICLGKMLSEDAVEIAYLVRCKHSYHRHCIFNWIRNNPTCPMCRSDNSNTTILI